MGLLESRNLAGYGREPHVGIASGSDEARYLLTGMANGVLLTVIYTERGEYTRIISARKATRHEQRNYYQNQAPA